MIIIKDVKLLPDTRLPVLKQVTGFQNEQPVIKMFQTPSRICVDDFDIFIHELNTRWLQNKQSPMRSIQR